MADPVEPASDFIFASDLQVRRDHVLLVVHMLDDGRIDVWMPRLVTDHFPRELLREIAACVKDFVEHVPGRPA